MKKIRREVYREFGFGIAGKDALRRLPFCFPPMPSLLSTSLTSSAPRAEGRFWFLDLDLERVSVSLRIPPSTVEEACSKVDIEAGRASTGFDILLRPSRAPLRSATPTPRVERARLCCEMFSLCMRAGEILRRGASPSPRSVLSNEDDRSTAVIGFE